MALLATLTVSLVAFIHIYILVLECFLWTTPKGRKSFGLTPSFAQQTKTLAANQGLYNGFLAAGLGWGLLHPVAEFVSSQRLFKHALAANLLETSFHITWAGPSSSDFVLQGSQIQVFFLGCVFVAGAVGAATTGKGKIFVIQSVPASAAFLTLWLL